MFSESPPYYRLAAGYDVVMEHVEYDAWAEYLHDILLEHPPLPHGILELGCGTGSLAMELQPLGAYRYTGTDQSPAMIEVARGKALTWGIDVQFDVADFTRFRIEPRVDAVLLLHDGLNYLLDDHLILDLFSCTYEALHPGGLFVFDQSTPANSINNAPLFEDEGQADDFSFVRRSHFDPKTQLHTTEMEMVIQGERYKERHVQQAYTLGAIRRLIQQTPFTIEAVYDFMTFDPADGETERPHWVLRKPL